MNGIFENKKIFTTVTSVFLIYIFIVVPVEKAIFNREKYRSMEEDFKEVLSNKKIFLKEFKELKKEEEILCEKLKEVVKNKEDDFSSLGEFQNFISGNFFKFNLETLEIGRTEAKNNDYFVPYLVKGNEKDLINFLMYMDNNKNINFLKKPLEIKTSENSAELRFSAGTRINPEKYQEEKIYKNRENILKTSEDNFEILKYISINDESGIFHIKVNGEVKKYFLKNGDVFDFKNSRYKINLSKDRLIFKKRFENGRERRLIFNLDEEAKVED